MMQHWRVTRLFIEMTTIQSMACISCPKQWHVKIPSRTSNWMKLSGKVAHVMQRSPASSFSSKKLTQKIHLFLLMSRCRCNISLFLLPRAEKLPSHRSDTLACLLVCLQMQCSSQNAPQRGNTFGLFCTRRSGKGWFFHPRQGISIHTRWCYPVRWSCRQKMTCCTCIVLDLKLLNQVGLK